MSDYKLIPEPNLHNLQLTVALLAQLNDSLDVNALAEQPESTIDAWLEAFAKSAAQNGNLQKLELTVGEQRIQLLFTVHPADGEASSSQQPSHSQFLVQLTEEMMPTTIYQDLKQAFKDYHSLARLDENPLVQLVQTDVELYNEHKCSHPSGLALRHLLDTLILQISGVSTCATVPPSNWRLEHYLHLRYHQKVKHAEIAKSVLFSERQLYRHRDKQIWAAAELCVSG
ncbi:MAG: hypothetical protein AAF702_20070 [Chloroflexota bacterium]